MSLNNSWPIPNVPAFLTINALQHSGFIRHEHLNRLHCYKKAKLKGGRVDVPLFETMKINAGTQPKNELQQ